MRKFLVFAAVVALCSLSVAQNSAGTETGSTVTGNASVQADRNGAQIGTSSNASVQSETSVQQDARSDGKAGVASSATHNSNQSVTADKSGVSAAGQTTSATSLQAVLTKTIDAKKAKAGDEVVAKTTQEVQTVDGLKIPRNTKLIGRVTEAKAKAKGEAQSSLGVVFERAVLKGGQEVPLHAIVQAVAAAEQPAMNSSADITGSSAMGAEMQGGSAQSGGGLLGGVGRTVSNTTSTVTNTVNNVGANAGSTLGGATDATVGSGVAATGALNSSSTGVIGIRDLQLSSASSSAGQASGSLFTSTSDNVRLESGTRLVLSASKQQ